VTEKPQPPSAELLNATKDVVEERGWTFVGWSNEVYTAVSVESTPNPTASSATPEGLVKAIDSYVQRRDATKPDWTPSGPMIVTGPEGPDEPGEEDGE